MTKEYIIQQIKSIKFWFDIFGVTNYLSFYIIKMMYDFVLLSCLLSVLFGPCVRLYWAWCMLYVLVLCCSGVIFKCFMCSKIVV